MAVRARGKGLSEQDRAEWAAYARGVAPMAGRSVPELVETAGLVTKAPAPRLPAPPPLRITPMPPLVVGRQPPGVDNATWDRLRTGKLAAARTLDLHGRTAQRGFHALEGFLRHAQAERQRCVEVITGRGAGEQGGVLRRELPLWLNLPALRPLVLAAAHPHAANTGSVRLLLRRSR